MDVPGHVGPLGELLSEGREVGGPRCPTPNALDRQLLSVDADDRIPRAQRSDNLEPEAASPFRRRGGGGPRAHRGPADPAFRSAHHPDVALRVAVEAVEDGVVREVCVAAGEQVEPGTVLLVVDPLEADDTESAPA